MRDLFLLIYLLIGFATLIEPTIPFLTYDNYHTATIYSEGVVVVEFWANWNAEHAFPLDKLKNAKLYRVDVDQQPYIVKEFEIETIPTIFIYVDGQLEYTEETDHTFKAKIDIFHIQQEIDKWN